ncbi:BamA/TamA family outer membrane protein [Rhodobacterales bacterium HKCCE2091]|nr:BamA/TamA family outer membrane protein [Rhodobacterales bacterium HKCCE2091]
MTVYRKVLISAALALAPAAVAAQDVRLDVIGANDDLRDRLSAASVLLNPAEDQTTGDLVAAARAEYARLLGVLYDEGYFAGVISVEIDGREAAQISPFSAPSAIRVIDITVNPGPDFSFGRATIGPLAPGDLPPEGYATGEPAGTGILRDAAQSGIDGWRDGGHAVAEIAGQSLVANNRDAILDADIRIAPGPRLDFGPLVPSGQERMPAARVVEIAGLPTGEVFSPAELERAANRLRRTGVFASVALNEGTPLPDGTIPIEAEVVEAPLRRIGAGVELSSVDGLTLSAYWLHRNLTGGGERLRFDAEISGIGQDSGNPDASLGASFSRPATATPDTTFTADALLEYLDEDTFQELHFDLTLGVEQQITDDLVGEIGVGLRFSDISDNFGDRQVLLLTLPIGLTYDRRDDPLDARNGYYLNVDLTPFYVTNSGEFGTRAELDWRYFVGIGENDRTRLAARLQLGTVEGGAITDLPPGYLFWSGGGGTVRGHDFHSLGAVQNGQDYGGRSFIGISGEVRQDITDRIGAVAFYDTGYVAPGPLWDDSGTWHAGAGLGLRYDTPLGDIRLDIAVPVSGPDPANDVFFYIGIGQSF